MKVDGIKIKLIMAEMEISQTVLAERAGISKQNISLILSRGTCTITNAGRIAKALGVEVREIVRED